MTSYNKQKLRVSKHTSFNSHYEYSPPFQRLEMRSKPFTDMSGPIPKPNGQIRTANILQQTGCRIVSPPLLIDVTRSATTAANKN